MPLEYATLVNVAIQNEIINSHPYFQLRQCIVKIIINEQNYLIALSSRNAQYKFPAEHLQEKFKKLKEDNHNDYNQTKGSSLSIL